MLWYCLEGNQGNTIDGQFVKDETKEDTEGEDERFCHSITPPFKPVSADRQYYHIPFDETKPCMHIKFSYQDHRRRLYLSNMLYKICEKLVSFQIFLLFLNSESNRVYVVTDFTFINFILNY